MARSATDPATSTAYAGRTRRIGLRRRGLPALPQGAGQGGEGEPSGEPGDGSGRAGEVVLMLREEGERAATVPSPMPTSLGKGAGEPIETA